MIRRARRGRNANSSALWGTVSKPTKRQGATESTMKNPGRSERPPSAAGCSAGSAAAQTEGCSASAPATTAAPPHSASARTVWKTPVSRTPRAHSAATNAMAPTESASGGRYTS